MGKSVSDRTSRAKDAEERLLSSALTLFSEKGYAATSVREIIESAGVTRPVLYYYFENKEALFRRLVEGQFARATADTDDVVAHVSGCQAQLKGLVRRAFERAERSPEIVRLVLQVFFSGRGACPVVEKDRFAMARMTRIAAVMTDGLSSGELRGGDARTLALAFVGVMDMYVMAKCHQPAARLTPELADQLVDLFVDGAGSEPPEAGLAAFPFVIED